MTPPRTGCGLTRWLRNYLILLSEGPQDKKASVDLYYEAFAEAFPEGDALRRRLAELVSVVRTAVPELKSWQHLRKPASFYSLIGALDAVQEASALPDPSTLGARLSAFEKELSVPEGEGHPTVDVIRQRSQSPDRQPPAHAREGSRFSRASFSVNDTGGTMTFDPGAYARDFNQYQAAATCIKEAVQSALAGSTHSIQEIQARAKHPDSAAEKQFRGGEQARDLHDLIGLRVVTLYDNAVPAVIDRLRMWFDEVPGLYRDKSEQLSEKEVGYRGVHLFLTNIQVSSDSLEVRNIAKTSVIEVQVKSLAAHTWAEAEHTLRYKAGDGVPENCSQIQLARGRSGTRRP